VNIGVLALQGDFAEHRLALQALGAQTRLVKLPEQLDGLSALIIPGGESTTIGKLAQTFELLEPLKEFGGSKAIWGTCAGAIFMSKDAHRDQPLLGLMDIQVERNAFGRQVDSFEIDLDVPVLKPADPPFHAVFIRAPLISSVGEGVEVLAELEPKPGKDPAVVAARQGKLLATSFHPELTHDLRFHELFLEMAR
jgi:5'-phosphate synthase pdxT subunit